MKCPIETREHELLVAYGAGTLDKEGAAKLEEHIGTCPGCRQVVREQQAVWQALDRWEAPAVSPDFDRRLYRRIQNEVSWWDLATRPFRPLLARGGLPVAAAVCAMIVAGVLIERPEGVTAPVPESAQVEAASPDQVERALDDMEMLREFNHLVRPDAGEPRM